MTTLFEIAKQAGVLEGKLLPKPMFPHQVFSVEFYTFSDYKYKKWLKAI